MNRHNLTVAHSIWAKVQELSPLGALHKDSRALRMRLPPRPVSYFEWGILSPIVKMVNYFGFTMVLTWVPFHQVISSVNYFILFLKNTRITRTKAKGKIYFLSLDSGPNVNKDERMTEWQSQAGNMSCFTHMGSKL